MRKKATPSTAAEKTRKKPGPVANPNLVSATVKLEDDLVEWGKNQPGGLSALLRRLLREEKEKLEQAAGKD
jgi:hypothetical protein